ncbi:peptidoglycan-binding protein [Streptomyces sp. NPDC058861]|uniref:peptidoglycan-binding protein n=1 Tax=Streptomyces sp. NPDC058861 TaxID=3346653 RepID=UPI0036814FD3
MAWCATFVSWVALKAGVPHLFPRTASCIMGVNWFRNQGRFSAYPAVGAQVFFGRNGATHTGIIVSYDATTITSIEGNTNLSGSPEGEGVYLKKWARKNTYVYGYGLPKYTEGVVTADPALKGKPGFTYATTASAPATGAPAPSTPTSSKRTVVVKAGQSLATIAAAAGVSLAAVLGLNPQIKNPDVIRPGDKVTVPAAPSPAKPASKPKPAAKPKVPAFPGAAYFKAGANNAHVTRLGEALTKKGFGRYYRFGPGPKWTGADRNAVRAFQVAQGWSGSGADGYPGPETWARLMR